MQKDFMGEKGDLTEAAKLGLRLPARGVLDLWALAYWVTHDREISIYNKHHAAEKIARTMLRNVIAESSLSSETGHHLQDQIIQRNPQGGTVLDGSIRQFLRFP